ncbi:actin cortical patch SUR7/pH-response regulator pali [Phycomyces nitens]|nr:actin cortical patch SUR7/pH-response regulator pali [Phycomyces nitens]
MSVFAYIATFFTFCALLLQVFTLLGNTYDQPFLKSLYFARFTLPDQFIQFGLWNYCVGSANEVTHCSSPVPAFDWTKADELSNITGALHISSNLFLVIFILYWIAFGLTLFAITITILSHFRRGPDFLASFSTFLSFLLMLVIFIMTLVVSLRSINEVKGMDKNGSGNLGPSAWMTLGAFAGLMLASLMYCVTCIFGPGKHVREVEEA